MRHSRVCTCRDCAPTREAFRERSKRVAARAARIRRWAPPLNSVWTSTRRTLFGLVMRDPSEAGAYRLQLFDKSGFYGHRTRPTLEDVGVQLHEEFGGRLVRVSRDVLDKMAKQWRAQ